MPLDDILKAIAKGGGPGAQIAKTAIAPTVGAAPKLAPAAMGPSWGKLAGKGLLAGYTAPQVAQHERREGPGGLFGAALTAIDLGRGIMTSTIKESIDFLQGEGINPGEWWNQATTQYGFGELIHDERNWVGGMLMASSPFTGGVGLALGAGVLADHIWADRVIGFIGDVAVDPLMYMGGFGAFARGAGYLGAVGQLGDVARVAKAAGKLTPAKKAAIDAATAVAGKKKSLSAATRELRKHGKEGAELIKDLGWTPGLRLRAPMSGPGGRMLRKVGGAGDRVWDVGSRLRGKPSWITANRVKQIPKYYDDLFDKRTLTEMVEAFGKGRKATADALKKFERQFAKESMGQHIIGAGPSVDKLAVLHRVAGQAAKAPLEIALPGLRFGPALGAAGLGGRFISEVADAPIRGMRAVTTQNARDKVALLFDPQGNELRKLFDSGNAVQVAQATGVRHAQRFAAGRAKFAERDINSASQKALNRIRQKRGISDTQGRRLEAILRGKDTTGPTERPVVVRDPETGEITGFDTTTHWFRELPEDLRELYRTDPERFVSIARAFDQRLGTVEPHMFTAYGDDLGADVLAKEGAEYSGHRSLNRDFMLAVSGEKPPQVDKRGYPVRGRHVPASLKERAYRVGGPLEIKDPKLLPPTAQGRVGAVQGVHTKSVKGGPQRGDPMVYDDGKPIYVLADETGNQFTFQGPNEVGVAFDEQVNRVTQQTFGKNLYEDRFSVLHQLQMRGIETDIKLFTLLRRLEEQGVMPVAGPDEDSLVRSLIADLRIADDLAEEAAAAKTARLKVEEKIDNRRQNETTAGNHAANREADSARWGAQAVEASEAALDFDIQLNDAMLVLARMQDEIGLAGSSTAEIRELAEQTRKLVEEGHRIGKQKTIRGEMLSKYDSIVEEAVLHQQQLDDLEKLLDDLDRLRPELERVIADDIAPLARREATVENARAGGVFFHGRQSSPDQPIRRGAPAERMKPRPGMHVGSKGAAEQRIGVPFGSGKQEGQLPIFSVEVTPRNPYIPEVTNQTHLVQPESKILSEALPRQHGLDAWGIQQILTNPERQAQLLAEGYDVIPYVNMIEDAGSLSYVILDPASVKVRPTPEWSVPGEPGGTPGNEFWGREVTRGMGGLEPTEARLAAAAEDAAMVEGRYNEALEAYETAAGKVEAAKAAYKENVYKALGARPAAERTAAVAAELEAKAARTAIADIGADPAVRSARLELEDAQAGLQAAAERRRLMRDSVAALEAQPGYKADTSAEGLATEPLKHANNHANRAVLTPKGNVKPEAYQARLDRLAQDLADEADALDKAVKTADKNAPKPKSTETPAQRAAATKKRKEAEAREQALADMGEDEVLTDWLDETADVVVPPQTTGGPVRTMPAETANRIKDLRGQIAELVAEERVLTARIQPDPFPMNRRGVVHKELEEAQAALAEAKANKLRGQNLRRQQLANAEEQLAAATNRKTRDAAQDRVGAARLAKDDPKHNDVFNAAEARVEAASKAVAELSETAPETVRKLKGQRTRKRNQIKALRDEAASLKLKDDALTREAVAEAGDYYAPNRRWRSGDAKKVASKQRRTAKANAKLKAESDPDNPSSLAGKVKQAKEVVDLRRKRDEAKAALDLFEQPGVQFKTTPDYSIPPGRLGGARARVRGQAEAVAATEARLAGDGGPVTIVGPTDPRVRNPRLYAAGPDGQGLVKIPRPKDQWGDNFALLRAVREGDGWKFTHLEQDLTGGMTPAGWKGPVGGRNDALIRAARRGSPKRNELRQQGWRFFDEDVAEGSTRIGGEAAQARRAATEAGRPLREATTGAAEAQRIRDTTVEPPKPDVPATTYASRAELAKAFDRNMQTARAMLKEAQHQLRLVNAALVKFAEEDVTSQAMRELRKLLKGLKRGVAGAEGVTASARVNRYMHNLKELDRLQRAVAYERSEGVENLQELGERIELWSKEIERIGGERGVLTELEEIIPGQPALQRRVPAISQEDLAGIQRQQDVIDGLTAERDAKFALAKQLTDKAEIAKRRGEKHRANEAKAAADVATMEAGALANAVELEAAIYSKRMSVVARRKGQKKRIDETVERLDRDGPFTLRSQDKDVWRDAEAVAAMREDLGVTDRAPLLTEEGKVADRSLRDLLDVAYSVERGGYSPTSQRGKLFELHKRERALAQEYLKSSLSGNEWGPWTLSQGHPFKQDMHEVINAFAKINNHEKWDGPTGFFKVWDDFQTYLKASMIATPGFVNRNIMGAFFNAWLDDVNPAEIMRSLQMTTVVAKRARKDGTGFYTAAKRVAKENPKYKQYVELLDVGVRGGGQAVRSVELQVGLRNAKDLTWLVGGRGRNPGTAVSLAPWSPRFAYYQGVRSVNSWVEDIVRLGVGMDTMRWGGNADDALKRIAKTQFDYDELTDFERKVMRRIFPFYTWTRKNVPYQLEQLARNPAKFNKILAGKRNLELGTKEEDIVPDYFLEPFGVRTPFKNKGATVYSAPDFPFQDLARYDPFDRAGGGAGQVARGVASMLTPILKAPLETAFGKQLYNGVPFTGRFQLAPAAISKFPGMSQALQGIGWMKKGPAGEWKMRDHHIYLVTNMLPSLGFLRRIAPNEPKYQRAYLRNLMSTIGGVSASFNTDEAKNNWLTNLRYERQEDRQRWKDMTSQTR
jgi:hypothetical protein